jgi:predicted component of type VI protein secretion system
MALNFTGRELPAPETPPRSSRAPVMVLGCFAIAAMLAGLVFLVALRQHKAETPPPLPPLVGADRATLPPAPAKAAAAPQPVWIEHKAAPQPQPAATAPPPQAAPATSAAETREADLKARMLTALGAAPHGRIALSIEDDPLAQAYADKLKALFQEAGWGVDETSSFGSGPPRQGVAAALGSSPADQAVRQAFDVIGFKFLPAPADAGVTRTPEIFVGIPPAQKR